MTGPEINARILALRLGGATWAAIAGDLGMNVNSVEYRVAQMRRAGCTLIPRKIPAPVTGPADWSDENKALFRTWWAEGVKTAEIGRRFGISKNSVVSKRRRMGLPERGSPIIRDGGARAARHLRLVWRPTATLAPLASVQTRPVAIPAAKPELAAPVRPAVRRVRAPCLWPEGEKPDYRWCGDPVAALGVPYCRDHMKRAYVRPTHRPGAP